MPPARVSDNSDPDERIARLESDVTSIGREVEGLRGDFQSFAREIRAGSKTNWGWIVAAVGAIVSILTGLIILGARGPLETIGDLKIHDERLQEREVKSAYDAGKYQERVDSLKSMVEVLHGNISPQEKGVLKGP